jgi:hypothetical protein
MKRTSMLGVLVSAVILLSAGPASALTKIREALPLFDHVTLTGFCVFPVVATDAGGQTAVTVLDAEGNLVRIEIHGSLFTTFEANGNSVTVNNSGPVTIVPNEDGSLTIYQRGQSVGADQGVITGEPFLIHQSGRLVSIVEIDPVSGFANFRSQTRLGVTTDLCALLEED